MKAVRTDRELACPGIDAGLLAEADFASVHAVLNQGTRHLIGEAEIAKLKPSVILINVSRGALIDEAALVRAVGGLLSSVVARRGHRCPTYGAVRHRADSSLR